MPAAAALEVELLRSRLPAEYRPEKHSIDLANTLQARLGLLRSWKLAFPSHPVNYGKTEVTPGTVSSPVALESGPVVGKTPRRRAGRESN